VLAGFIGCKHNCENNDRVEVSDLKVRKPENPLGKVSDHLALGSGLLPLFLFHPLNARLMASLQAGRAAYSPYTLVVRVEREDSS